MLSLISISSISASEVTINETSEGGIKKAINNGNTTINLEKGTYEGNTNTDININKGQNITIKGMDSINKPIISLRNTNNTWFIQNSGNLTLINLVIKDSFVNGLGGALLNDGNLIVVNCTFINTSSAYGGAIHSLNDSNLIIINSIFNETDAYQMGGAISIDYGSNVIIRGSEFINNKARTHGGAIYNNGTLYLDSDNFFIENTADEYNDIYNTGSIYSMPDPSFSTDKNIVEIGEIITGTIKSYNQTFGYISILSDNNFIITKINGVEINQTSNSINFAIWDLNMIGEGFFSFEIKFTKEGYYDLDIMIHDTSTANVICYTSSLITVFSTNENINNTNSTNNTNNTENNPLDPNDPVEPIEPVDPVDLVDPTGPEDTDDTSNTTENNNNPTTKAAMKETGIPIIAILIVLLSSLGLVYRKK